MELYARSRWKKKKVKKELILGESVVWGVVLNLCCFRIFSLGSIKSLVSYITPRGGPVAQWIYCLTHAQEVLGLIPAPGARATLVVGSVSVYDRLRQKSRFHCAVLCVAACKIVRRQS